MKVYDAKHFQILRALLGIFWNRIKLDGITEIDRTIFVRNS